MRISLRVTADFRSLVNREQGTYKGYPLYEDEWPEGIADHYG